MNAGYRAMEPGLTRHPHDGVAAFIKLRPGPLGRLPIAPAQTNAILTTTLAAPHGSCNQVTTVRPAQCEAHP